MPSGDRKFSVIVNSLLCLCCIFLDPFGGDPFKGSDPFASDCFFKQSSTDPFATSSTDPFCATSDSSNTSVSGRVKWITSVLTEFLEVNSDGRILF